MKKLLMIILFQLMLGSVFILVRLVLSSKTKLCVTVYTHQLKPLPHVKCTIEYLTIERRGSIWIGGSSSTNNTTVDLLTSPNCQYSYSKDEIVNILLNQSDTQCDYNNRGTLCGQCQPGFSLALGTPRCLKPSNKYIFIENPLTLFISWFNLDLGVETFFFDGLSAYGKVWLQFLLPIYIWSIARIIIALAKYNMKVVRVMGNNSVPVLATLFLLSYANLLHNSITVISYSIVQYPHDTALTFLLFFFDCHNYTLLLITQQWVK